MKITKIMTATLALILTLALTSTLIAPANSAVNTFHSHETLIAMFKTLYDQHPNVSSYEVVGHTYEGRDIYLFKIGNPDGGRVLWDGCLHGWEDLGAEVEYKIAEWLLTSNTPEAQRILQNNYVLFVPVINVDSYARENRDFRSDRYGVDLNRNFVTGFRYVQPYNTGYPNSYHGDYGGSEPETQAMRNVFRTYRPTFYLNTHYGGAPFLSGSSSNSTLLSLVTNRINELSSQAGFTFPYSIRTSTRSGGGGGLITADASSFGASAWTIEMASESDPIDTGQPSGGCFDHTAHSLSDVQNYFFPRMLTVMRAMCEASQDSPGPVPTPTPQPTPKPTSTPTPTPTHTPQPTPEPTPTPSNFPSQTIHTSGKIASSSETSAPVTLNFNFGADEPMNEVSVLMNCATSIFSCAALILIFNSEKIKDKSKKAKQSSALS